MKRLRVLAAALSLAACSQTTPQLGLDTARAALEGGAPQAALNICNQIAARGRDDADVFACQGDAYAAMGQPAEADAAYARGLALHPASVPLALALGRLRLATDPRQAEELFLTALKQGRRNAAALNDLGIARDLQGRHAEAQQAYGEAIAADPDMRAAQVNLALSMALSGRTQEAATLLRPLAGNANATARERHDLAAVLAMDGHVDEATRLLSPDLHGADLDAAIAGYRSLLAH